VPAIFARRLQSYSAIIAGTARSYIMAVTQSVGARAYTALGFFAPFADSA